MNLIPENLCILVVGSRNCNDAQFVFDAITNTIGYYKARFKIKDIVIVSGGCKGVDDFAESYARFHGYTSVVFNADWYKFGLKAGYIRNREMHEFISKYKYRHVIAIWDGESKGTYQSFELSERYNNPIKVIQYGKDNI